MLIHLKISLVFLQEVVVEGLPNGGGKQGA
jgi:hypothetical protein